MNNILVFLAVLLISAPSWAMETEVLSESSGEITALIKNPKHFGSDLPFAASSASDRFTGRSSSE